MLEKIDYNNIKKYKLYITTDLHTNSKIFFDKKILYKIPHYPKEHLESVLNHVEKSNLKGLIKVRGLVYKNDLLVGYAFDNYKDYNSLKKFKRRDQIDKLKDCFKILKIFSKLSKQDMVYNDYHLGNILLNKKTGDIKICDLDAIYMCEDDCIKMGQLDNSLYLCLSYLYNLDYDYVKSVLRNGTKINSKEFMNAYLEYKKNKSFENAVNVLNNFDFDLIKKEKGFIKSLGKKFDNIGYYGYRC